jgi:predicted phage-related endonuclease
MSALLSTLGLSKDAIAARKFAIGGSDANTIMSGDEKRILNLWREKRGEVEGEDLSDNLEVQMGSFTEPLNIAWFEKNTGLRVSRRGDVARLDTAGFPMACTLDGIATSHDDNIPDLVFEAKHTGTRSTDAEIFARYVPQLTHNSLCAGTPGAWLSVFKGNGDWVVFEYALDDNYAERLLDAERAFWDCVVSGEPPCPLPPVTGPKPVGVVEYDMHGNNAWASLVVDYRETLIAASRHDTAKTDLKLLVPPDASLCAGHGLTIKRDKRGALRFTLEETNNG